MGGGQPRLSAGEAVSVTGLRGKLSVHAVMGTWGTAERRGAMEAVRYRA